MNIRGKNCEIWIAKGIFYFTLYNLIHIHLHNPFATWWKARKYFRKPSAKIKFGILKYHFPYANRGNIASILDIWLYDVGWKDKWNSPRHESNPFMWICLFKLFTFEISTYVPMFEDTGETRDGSMYYWEYMLDYLYYSKKLSIKHCWNYTSKVYRKYNTETKEYEPCQMVVQTPLFSLNKRGLKEFNKIYEQAAKT